jgi:hypothetical protein
LTSDREKVRPARRRRREKEENEGRTRADELGKAMAWRAFV